MKKLFCFTVIAFLSFFSFSISQEARQFILYENVEGIIPPVLPTGWTVNDANGDGRTWRTRKFGGHSTGPQCFKYSSDPTVDADDWFFSTPVELYAGVTHTLTFRYKVSAGTIHKMNVFIGNSPTPAGMTTQIFSSTSLSDSLVTEVNTDFNTAATGIYYLGFHCFSGINNGSLDVDDILVSKQFSDLKISFVFTESILNGVTTAIYSPTDTIEGEVFIENIGPGVIVLNTSFNVGKTYAPETGIAYIVIDPDGDTLDYVLKSEPEPFPQEQNFKQIMPGNFTGRTDDLQKLFWFLKTGTYTLRVIYQNYYKSQTQNAWLGRIISAPLSFSIQ